MLSRTASVLFLSLPFVVACGGGEAAAGEPSPSSSSAGAVESSPEVSSGDREWLGLWIDDKGSHLRIEPGLRYAKFDLSSASQDLRYADLESNEFGERVFPTYARHDGWERDGELLVAYKHGKDADGNPTRTRSRDLRRLDADELVAYWQASAGRLVRNGLLDEIREAEAAGFDFASIVDPTIVVAQPGERLHLDMLEYAVENGQRAVVEHFLEVGHDLDSSGAVRAAMKAGDVELTADLLDRGYPLQQTVAGTYPVLSDDVWVLLLERGLAIEGKPPVLAEDTPRAGAMLVESDRYDDYRMLSPVVAAGRVDLIEKVLSEHPQLTERPDLLFSLGVLPALRTGQTESLDALVAAGAPLDLTFGRKTAMTVAAAAGRTESLAYLIEAGHDVHAADGSRQTALDAAISGDAAPATFEFLFEAGLGPTAAHLAAVERSMRSNKDAVKALLQERLGN